MKRYRIKEGYILREIAGEKTIIPADPESQINGLIIPNETSAVLWEVFQNSATIRDAVDRLLQEYEVDEETAENAVQKYVQFLLSSKMLVEDE